MTDKIKGKAHLVSTNGWKKTKWSKAGVSIDLYDNSMSVTLTPKQAIKFGKQLLRSIEAATGITATTTELNK